MCTLQYQLAGLIKKDAYGVIQNIYLIWGKPESASALFLERLDKQLEQLKDITNSASKKVSVSVDVLPPSELEALGRYDRGSSLYAEVRNTLAFLVTQVYPDKLILSVYI